MLLSYGVTFEIVAGCWGVQAFDFRFNDVMLTNKTDDEISYYAKWCGLIDSHKLNKDMWLKGNSQMASHMKERYGEGLIKWYENGEIKVSYPKKSNFHKGHITSFITSYQRMNVIEQLMNMDIKKIIRVCVDGIYHSQTDVVYKNVFRAKTDRKLENIAGLGYISNDESIPIIKYAPFKAQYAKELHIGAGGNGKTHLNLVDTGLVKVLYVAPPWKLARNKQGEYKCNVNVWANIFDKGSRANWKN